MRLILPIAFHSAPEHTMLSFYVNKDRVGCNTLVAVIICLLSFVLPVNIANIAFYWIQDRFCNNSDILGLDVADYLLVSGCSALAYLVVHCGLTITRTREMSLVICVNVGMLIFRVMWTVIGALIVFRANIPCYNEENSQLAIYATFIVCIDMLCVVCAYVMCGSHRPNATYIEILE